MKNINREDIDKLVEYVSSRVPLHSLAIINEGETIYEEYFAPYDKDGIHRMFSISKSMTALAIGCLVDEGKINLDDRVYTYFEDKMPENPYQWTLDVTIRNCIMMRSCHSKTSYDKFAGAEFDYVGSFFTKKPDIKPGTLFHYDTGAAHVMAALVERVSGQDIMDYLRDRLKPLGLSEDSYFIKDPQGVSLGGSGYSAHMSDQMKIGQLILGMGAYNGQQLISKDYIQWITSNLSSTLVAMNMRGEYYGYGAYFWRTSHNGIMVYGMGAQYILVYPDENLIICTTGDTQGEAGGNQVIFDGLDRFIFREIELPVDEPDDTASRFFGVEYKGNDRISYLKIEKDHFDYVLDGVLGTINFSFEDYGYGLFPQYDKKYGAHAQWLSDGTLYVRVQVVDDLVGAVHFQFALNEEDATIFTRQNEETKFREYIYHHYLTRR